MELGEDMSTMEIRLIMKDNGWSSKDELSKIGWGNKYGYSIWFERRDWHDVNIDNVCIHAHTNNLNEIGRITYRTALKCLKAWKDFKNSVPFQMVDGDLATDSVQTALYHKTLKDR